MIKHRKAVFEVNVQFNVTCPYCDNFFDACEAICRRCETSDEQLMQSYYNQGMEFDYDILINCPKCIKEIDIIGME